MSQGLSAPGGSMASAHGSRIVARRWLGRTVVGIAILVLQTRHAAAQTVPREIAGRVTDRDGVAVAGATISIAELSRAATSDATGRFRLADVPVGTFTVSARQIGYKPAASRVVVGASAVTVDLVLT